MTEYGKTPYLTAQQFQEMGYRMVIYPVSAMRVVIKAIYELFTEIRSTGTQKRFLERMFTRDQLYELIGYKEMLELEKQFAAEVPKR
jgi:methylisocitrate lyase